MRPHRSDPDAHLVEALKDGRWDADPDPALARVIEACKAAGPPEESPGPRTESEPDLDFLSPGGEAGQLGRLGPYAITEVIGRGGMGIVLKGYDPRLGRLDAIKVLDPGLASEPRARALFRREARAAAAIKNDHVVTIYAVDEANGVPYLVMEYVPGGSLQRRLERGAPLSLGEILRIGRQTASGLAAAHARGVIHRDIKPGNILLDDDGARAKVSDFGLARAADDVGMTRTGTVLGTPAYMAPEQAQGERVDHRADLFSLGSVLYRLCTGEEPFRGEALDVLLHRVCAEEPRPIREINPEIPEWLVALIAKLHAKDPADRFQSAAEVARLLRSSRPPLTFGKPPKARCLVAVTLIVATLGVAAKLTSAPKVDDPLVAADRLRSTPSPTAPITDGDHPDVSVALEARRPEPQARAASPQGTAPGSRARTDPIVTDSNRRPVRSPVPPPHPPPGILDEVLELTTGLGIHPPPAGLDLPSPGPWPVLLPWTSPPRADWLAHDHTPPRRAEPGRRKGVRRPWMIVPLPHASPPPKGIKGPRGPGRPRGPAGAGPGRRPGGRR